MTKNGNSNLLIIEDYESDQEEEYMNIASLNHENFKTKKFEKFKSKNSMICFTNLLKGEEDKLKKMLFSILRSEESQSMIAGKSSINNSKIKLFNTNILSSIEDENHRKKSLSKNYKQFKKNSKSLKIKNPRKLKRLKSEIELLDNNYTPKNIYSKLCITPKNYVKKTFSHENSKLKKKLTNIHSSISNSKESKKNYSLFIKNEIDNNSDDNRSSTNCLKTSSKKEFEKMSDKHVNFLNTKEEKNCHDINTSKTQKIKNSCILTNKNNEEKNKNYKRNFTLKNQKNTLVENFNNTSRNKNPNFVCTTIKNINKINNLKMNVSKSEKFIKQLKLNNLKILKINKEKIKKNLIIRPDDQKRELKHCESSCLSNREVRPKIPDSLNLPPQRFCSTKESIKNRRKSLSNINKNEELNKKEIKINKSIKIISIISEKYRKLIHRKLVYDSLDDEELEFEEMASNNFYIDPNSRFCFIFDLIIFFLTVYNSMAIPYFLAKNLRVCKEVYFSSFHLFNCLSEIFNVMDTILGFFRAYYNYDEQLIKKSILMTIQYVKTWFLIDLISSIPFYSIFSLYEPECAAKIFNKYYNYEMHNLHYIFLCSKMIKLFKVFKNNRGYKGICKILNNHLIFQNKGALIARTYMTILIIHFGACIHIFVARNSYPNWILITKMENNRFLEIYLTALYCLTMTITTVGFGDITCYSFTERIFQIILLIFGIGAYSWIVSSISNYIKKYNNDLNDYTQKIDTLKDIKLHHPNMSNKLYNKITQYLKYKNRNEKQNKNLIFDCLPLSLKNNLIFEMYKPIITKFIFFKNIDNIDFIVKVVLAFRPVIAVKNDIMVNDGDMVEEIVFVKKGVLIVQLLINIENYKENVDRYSTMNLFNLQNKSNLENTFHISDKTLSNNNLMIERLINNETKNSLSNNSVIKTCFEYKKIKKITDDKSRKYIKIINIRENEHFGDVLMFSGQRSPMRVMVRSTKAELFLLKKEDVVKISFAYSNIWRRINEKSVYNFEQMKKSIQKIMEILSPQTLKTTIFYSPNETENDEVSDKCKKDDNKEKNNSSKQKSNEENDSRNVIESSNFDSVVSSSYFTETVVSNKIEKEIKNKDMRNKENIKDQDKTENSLILSQYSKINNDNAKFNSESNTKSQNELKIIKNGKKQAKNISNFKKRNYSFTCFSNKNNRQSIKNNNVRSMRNQRRMKTPYRKEEVNQEIYDNEKFELTNVDENIENLFNKKKHSDNIKKNKNNDINSKSEIKYNYIVDKLSNINFINNVKKINNINNINNNIISKGDYFLIESSYENFNSLSKNVLIYDIHLQKKMKLYLKKQIICQKPSHKLVKIKNLNLESKINDGNLGDSSSKKIKISINKNDLETTVNNISFDSKYYNNNISINGPSYNNIKKDSNENIINLLSVDSIKKIPHKLNSPSPINNNCIARKLTLNSSSHPLNKLVKNSVTKMKKNNDRSSCKSNKSNNNLLSLINDNILNSRENMIQPDKFYRRYFNALISNNNNINNQSFSKKEKYRSHKTRDNIPNYSEENKHLSSKIKVKRPKSCCNKENT